MGMNRLRCLSWLISVFLTGSILAGCTGTVPGKNAAPPIHTDAVYIQRGALFGIDLASRTVRELVPREGDTDFATELALFTGDGQSLLIHRNKDGRDSWWAARSDGSHLRRLSLPVDRQIRQVAPLGRDEFVGVMADGRFIRFDLAGRESYWQPEGDDVSLRDAALTVSPDRSRVAYAAADGVVVLQPQDDGLGVAHRTSGTAVHGWLGAQTLVTGDAKVLYVADFSSGSSRKTAYGDLLGHGSGIVTVAVHPKGERIYVVRRSSIPGGRVEIAALEPVTLKRLPALPHAIPPGSKGAPRISPFGSYEAWPVEPSEDLPYEERVALVKAEDGSMVHSTDAAMLSVPHAFHPADDGFAFVDMTRGGTILVYQDVSGQRMDLSRSADGYPFTGFSWNPLLSGVR